MKKSVFNVALAILISLGVVACKSTDNPVKETPKELKKPEGGKAEGGKPEGEKAEGGKPEGGKAEGNKIPTGFEAKPAAEKIKYLKENNIQAVSNQGPQPAGTIVAGHAKTYASYAAVREADESNKYIIDSTMYTPISQKDYVAKLDATYVGKSSMTSRGNIDQGNSVEDMNVTFKVKDNYISGNGLGYVDEKGKQVTVEATFDRSEITIKDNKLGFGGNFSLSLQGTDIRSNNGSYEGYFSGNKAEEVVGKINATFENAEVDDDSGRRETQRLTGAFVAEKQ